tara:strand:+ start:435 stop:632 length:198 start_codon:yes stop_codon:yes gene_type:complete
MKKFNKMESNLICDSLNYYVANLETEILKMQKNGKQSIFAPGFYTNFADELVDKIKKDMTKKQKV